MPGAVNLCILTLKCQFFNCSVVYLCILVQIGAYWCIPVCHNIVNYVLHRSVVHTTAYWCIPVCLNIVNYVLHRSVVHTGKGHFFVSPMPQCVIIL
jgi:hypothetical protein